MSLFTARAIMRISLGSVYRRGMQAWEIRGCVRVFFVKALVLASG